MLDRNRPFNELLFILKSAYREFVERVGHVQAPLGSKTEQILAALSTLPLEFTLSNWRRHGPG
jgi:hypothetical protein